MRRVHCVMTVLLLVLGWMAGPGQGLARAAIQETETNDDFASADWMNLGESYYGDLGYRAGNPPDQQDYFRFNLSKDQPFSVTVKVSYSMEGLVARVYDPNQQEMNSSLMLMGGRQWECNRSAGSSPGVWYLVLTSAKANYTIDSWTIPPYVDPVPKISIISPANGSQATSLLVAVSGNASDDKSVASVYVFPEGVPPQNWTLASGTTQWSATVNISEQAAHGGSILLWAQVTDTDGNKNNTTVTVIYNNHRPKIMITSPINGSTVSSLLVQFKVSAWDDKCVTYVYVFVEGEFPYRWTEASGSKTAYTAVLNISGYCTRDGPIRLCANAEDSDGNMNESNITVFYCNSTPKVTINLPKDNAIVKETLVEVSGNAWDDKSVAKVEVYPQGTLNAFRTLAEGTTSWRAAVNLSNVAVHGGAVRIFANVTDSDNNTNETFITMVYQNFSPRIAIQEPLNNSVVNETMVMVVGYASDDSGIDKVELAPEGAPPWDRSVAHGTVQWWGRVNISGYIAQDKSARIIAYVTDSDGNLNSTTVRVFYNGSAHADVTRPTVSITFPTLGLILTDPNITVNGTADDNVGVSSVRLRLNQGTWRNVTLVPGTGTRVVWNMSLTLPAGLCSITAIATDAAGNEAECGVSFSLGNPPDTTVPGIRITYPTENLAYLGDSIVVRGTAMDNIGIARVEAMVVNYYEQTPWQNATTIDGWRNWSTEVPLREGVNDIKARVTDLSGWNMTATVRLFVTTTDQKPVIHISYPQNGYSTDKTTITIRGNVSDSQRIYMINLTVNNQEKGQIEYSRGSGTVNWSAPVSLREGGNFINVTAIGLYGNRGYDEVLIICTSIKRPFLPGFELPSMAIVLLAALFLLSNKRRQ